MSVCYDCVLLCLSVSVFCVGVPGHGFWPKLNQISVNTDLHFVSPQVQTSGPALVGRPPPPQIMRTPFTHW